MQKTQFENSPSSETKLAESAGCGSVLAWVGLGLWTLLVSFAALAAMSVAEQDQMMKVHAPMDLRWLILAAQGAAFGLAGLAVWFFTRRSRAGQAARLLILAGVFVALQAPARLVQVQDAQLGLVLQLTGVLIFALILGLDASWHGRKMPTPSFGGSGWAMALGGLLGLPWVVFCALGSPLDTILAFIVVLTAGGALVLALQPVLRQSDARLYAYGDFFGDGLLAALFLLAVATALGSNGTSVMLALTIPWLGWAIAGLYQAWPSKGQAAWLAPALLLGLALFWPLSFVDLEELLILLAAPGEAPQWVWIATGFSMMLCVIVLLCAAVLLRFWLRYQTAQLVSWAAAGGIGLVLCGAYLLAGHPGFYGERLFVILKDQADVSSAKKIADPLERRKAVYQILVRQADSSQAALRAALDTAGVAYTPYYLVNAVEVRSEPLLRFVFASRPEVDRVLIDTRLRPLFSGIPKAGGMAKPAPNKPEWNLEMISAPRVWDELQITGQGVVVGQSDTGVQGDHPELAAGYLNREANDNYSWYDPWYGSSSPVDYGGHGTHTLGTVLGGHVGVAPGASWIGCVNLGRDLANPALYLDCMQFHLAPFPQKGDPLHDGKPEWGANVLNNSWGCPTIEGCDGRALEAAAQALRTAGVFVVVSAGNDGEEGCATVASPLALYGTVTSVGAVGQDGALASFSSLGPVIGADGQELTKPDLLAPGEEIYSAYPGSGYTTMSGTSMAGPHVAGVVALLWSANPKLIGDIDRTEQILRQTAKPYLGVVKNCGSNGARNTAGYGVVDAYAAVKAALSLK